MRVVFENVNRDDLRRVMFKCESGGWDLIPACDCGQFPPPLPTCNWKCRVSMVYHRVRARFRELPQDFDLENLSFASQSAVQRFINTVNTSGDEVLQCGVCMDAPIFYYPCSCRYALCVDCLKRIETPNCYGCRNPLSQVLLQIMKAQHV